MQTIEVEEGARLFTSIFNSGYCFFLNLIKENNSQLKKKLHNLEEALESTRQSAKNEEHKSNLLIAEKVKKLSQFLLSIFIRK